MREAERRVVCAAAACGAALLTGACTTDMDRSQASLEGMYAAGRFDLAAAHLDDPHVIDTYGQKNKVLWQLERGSVARALGQHEACIGTLEEAERTAEVTTEKSAGDVVGSWVLNDTAAKYIPEPYEDVYINVIKLLAQLEAGNLVGGATVEARRLSSKADRLRDRYLEYREATSEELRKAGAAGARGADSVVRVNKAGEFVESPLGTYLTAVTFMKSGEPEFQRVAARRLIDSIRVQGGLIGPVREEEFAPLESLDPRSSNVLVVALSGRGPTKYPERVGPIPLGTVPVYFELPRLQTHPSRAASAYVEIEGQEEGSASGAGGELALVEDLSLVATVNHERALPLIYARTLARYAVKAGLSVWATEAMRKAAHDSNQGWVQLGGVLLGLAVLGATEHADLRCWVFLPGQARVGLLSLPAGEHKVRVVYRSGSGGTVYESEWKTIHVSGDSDLATVVTQYWD